MTDVQQSSKVEVVEVVNLAQELQKVPGLNATMLDEQKKNIVY